MWYAPLLDGAAASKRVLTCHTRSIRYNSSAMSHRMPLRTFQARAWRQRHAHATLSHAPATLPHAPAAALCSGAKGIHSGSRRPFTYKGTKFHRVVKSFMAQVPKHSSAVARWRPVVASCTACTPLLPSLIIYQGGDFIFENGSGGEVGCAFARRCAKCVVRGV